jgi:hypothetical protein
VTQMIFSDGEGEIRVDRSRSDLIVGPDTKFIRLCHALRVNERQPSLEDLSFNQISKIGLYASTHLIDCRADDPDDFRVVCYGANARLEGGLKFQGQCFGNASWYPLRKYVATEYSRIKASAKWEVADVTYDIGDRSSSYRRLLPPLADNRGEVTHLLMGFLHH